jgi:hypothetical protein
MKEKSAFERVNAMGESEETREEDRREGLI